MEQIKFEDLSLYVAVGKNGIYWIPRKREDGKESSEPINNPTIQEKQLLLSMVDEVAVRLRMDLQRSGIIQQ